MEIAMATSNVPVRVPDPQPEPAESTSTPSRPAAWVPERKPSRFIIKVGGVIPS
jgi:hypothetical protein